MTTQYKNLFKVIANDQYSEEEFQQLSDLFIKIRHTINTHEVNQTMERDLANLILKAFSVFGTAEQTDEWLGSTIPALGSRAPVSLLVSSDGYDLAMKTLRKIEHGEYS